MAEIPIEVKLQRVIQEDAALEYEWPKLRSDILSRLAKVAVNDFPQPPGGLPWIPDSKPQSGFSDSDRDAVCKTPSKNAGQGESSTLSASLSSPPFDGRTIAPVGNSSEHSNPSGSHPVVVEHEGLPHAGEVIDGLLNSIRTVLEQDFPEKAPHTIQRLAELVLYPREYYQYLPAYLSAILRVVAVCSNIFAFDELDGHANGAQDASDDTIMDSEESLGGAVLTTISWITNRSPPAPNGDFASLESPNSSIPVPAIDGGLDEKTPQSENDIMQLEDDYGPEEGAETPGSSELHITGPEEIGMEDTGKITEGGVGRLLHEASTQYMVAGKSSQDHKAQTASAVDDYSASSSAPTTTLLPTDPALFQADLPLTKMEFEGTESKKSAQTNQHES